MVERTAPRRPAARAGRLALLVVMVVSLGLAPVRSVRAQPVRTRILAGMEVSRRANGFRLSIQFTTPVRYLRHVPQERGDDLQIQLDLIAVDLNDAPAALTRESLRVPRDIPLQDVVYEGDSVSGPALGLTFTREVTFHVEQGSDLRSLIIEVDVPQAARAPSDDDPAHRWMEEARSALAAGDSDRAIGIYEKILSLPENPDSREAKELLGVARERKGQLAHAKAEYDEYLERYPDGEASDRVRQRRAALLTLDGENDNTLREPTPGRRASRADLVDLFGSLSLGYRRDVRYPDGQEAFVSDSSLYTDIQLVGRHQGPNRSLRAEFAGSYRFDFLAGREGDDPRVSSLFVELDDEQRGFSGTLGRQSRSTGGVLGRFDGARLGYRLREGMLLTWVAGLPVQIGRNLAFDTNEFFYGVSVDFAKLGEVLDLQLFAIHQIDDGMTDRAAIGGELRYFDGPRFVAGYLDYDVYYRSLNTALVTGSWRFGSDTTVTFLGDYRNSPVLTTSNALQGQSLERLEELLVRFDPDEIQALAQDRTARSLNATVGVSHRLNAHWQMSADAGVSEFTGTPASGGVEGTEGTGLEPAVFVQLIGSDLLRAADVQTVGLRWVNGRDMDTLSFILNGRYPLLRALRLNPQLRVDYRNRASLPNAITVRPTVRTDYRIGRATLDAEAGCEWSSSGTDATELGLVLGAGVRWDF